MTDASGMQYLRARYYAPSTGRFISRDVWEGDPMQPMGYNLWLYAYSNPIMYVDPSGHFNWVTGLTGGILNTAAYAIIESGQDDGLNLKDDWKDMAWSFGQGFVAGTLAGTPGTQGIGIGMISNMASDHIENAVTGQDFDIKEHAIYGATGAAEGFVGSVLSISEAKPIYQVLNSGYWGGINNYATASLHGEASFKDFATGFALDAIYQSVSMGWYDEIGLQHPQDVIEYPVFLEGYTSIAVEGMGTFIQSGIQWIQSQSSFGSCHPGLNPLNDIKQQSPNNPIMQFQY